MAHGITAGALLLETDDHGNETTLRVQSVSRHPRHLDSLLIWGENGTGRVLEVHLSDWLRRVIEN
jgi:hypothetical protein